MGMSIDEFEEYGNMWIDINQDAKETNTFQFFSMAIDTMRKYQQLQADYENRLKADLKAMLVELQTEIEELCIDNILSEDEEDINRGIEMAADAIQEKINELKGK